MPVKPQLEAARPDRAGAAESHASRRSFLRSSTIAGIAAAPMVGMLAANARGVFDGDADEAARRKAKIARDFKSVQAHENAHVAFLKDALKSAARPKPTFKGLEAPSYEQFVRLSQAFENTGVGAYLGAAPYIKSKTILASASPRSKPGTPAS